MLRPLLLFVWISAIAASSTNRFGRIPRGLARRLDSTSSPVAANRNQYYVSTKTADSNETESWWPLWRSSTTNTTTTIVKDKDPQPQETKPRRRWGVGKAKQSEEQKEEENKVKEEPKKKEKKKGKKAKAEDTEDKEEKDSESKKDAPKGKKEKSKGKKEKEEPVVEADETDVPQSNSTDVSQTSNSTSTESDAEKARKKEALQRYKELYALRQQLLSSGPPQQRDGRGVGGGPMNQDEYYRQMRNAETSMAAVQIMNSLIAIGVRWSVLLWATRYLANRQELIHPIQHFVFERLNDRFIRDAFALRTAIDEPPVGISKMRWGLVLGKRNRTPQTNVLYGQSSMDQTFEKTAIVIELGNDSDADMDMRYLADLVTFLLSQHQAYAFGTAPQGKRKRGDSPVPPKPLDLEVIFKLNSPGGPVATFGLAAAQLKRLRGVEGITTTICVDKFAASGGYMMASQANKLVAAPFAYIGSIGVIMETLNFHDILKSYGVTPVVLKAGEGKNPVTTYGPVTKTEMAVEIAKLEKVHEQFKQFTIEGRPQLEGQKVFDGSVFMGQEALGLNLVDEVMTSDEYLLQRMRAGDRVLKVYRSRQSRMAPHMRFPTAFDILPHLKSRIEVFLSNPDIAAKLVQAGSFVGFLHHLVSNYLGKAK